MLPSLILALAPTPSDLSPEAAEYNAKAMRFYDAGQLAPAVDEFHAAYQSMPDARRDLAQEGLMIALGVTGGALITAGTALLVRETLQRRRARLGFDLRQHPVGLTISGEF